MRLKQPERLLGDGQFREFTGGSAEGREVQDRAITQQL